MADPLTKFSESLKSLIILSTKEGVRLSEVVLVLEVFKSQIVNGYVDEYKTKKLEPKPEDER